MKKEYDEATVHEEVAFRLLCTFNPVDGAPAHEVYEATTRQQLRGWVKVRKIAPEKGIIDLHLEGPRLGFANLMLALGQIDQITATYSFKVTVAGHNELKLLAKAEEDPRDAEAQLLHLAEVGRTLSATVLHQAVPLWRAKTLRESAVSQMLELMPVDLVPESIRRKFKGVKSNAASSFSAEMWSQTYMRDAHKRFFRDKIEFKLEDKNTGLSFAKILGLRTPSILSDASPLAALRFFEGSVVKPEAGGGSRGVYIIREFDNIVDLRRGVTLTTLRDLRTSMQEDIKQGRVRKDCWTSEELLTRPDGGIPRDLKFYTFYGECPIVLEIDRNQATPRFCWWDGTGSRIRTGKYDDDLFVGEGFDPAWLEAAKKASLQIPAPFVRVDFLAAKSGITLGEVTPRPGSFHQFNVTTDRRLGRLFVDARARLFNDIRSDKRFAEFDAA